jgi:hypothetical protein
MDAHAHLHQALVARSLLAVPRLIVAGLRANAFRQTMDPATVATTEHV